MDQHYNQNYTREEIDAIIGEYFSAVKAKYNMVNPTDIKTYSRAMFLHKYQ